ncbi:MAG: transporter substrate-binding domain-containing protein [Pseudomonadota bacterium]
MTLAIKHSIVSSITGRLLATLLMALLPSLASAQALRVALSPDYMPLAFKQEGKLLGIEVDNAREVANILGRKLEFVEMSQADYVTALNERRVDVVMSGYSITPEREAQVAFTRPFMQVGQMAIVLAERAGQFAYPRALYKAGITMGAEPGTTGERFIKENFPAAGLAPYATPDAAFAALRSRELDVFIHDAPTSWNLASTRDNQDLLSLYRPLTREQMAWAVRRDNTRLLSELNQALAELENNGRLSAIQNYWIPVTVQVR